MMRGDKSTNNPVANNPATANLPEERVPKIRLKLKVPIKATSEPASEPASETKEISAAVSDTIKDISHVNTTGTTTTVNTAVPSSPNSSSKPLSPSLSQSPSSSSSSFYGTFKYRPFKLFPLLPPSSRYRVLIPAKHTTPRHNPAFKLNYLWQPPSDYHHGVYTDDSDLVCVLVREGRGGMLEGKNLLVEVEVLGVDDLASANIANIANVNRSDSTQDANKQTVNAVNSSYTIKLTPRSYSNHDGHFIRVTNCTVDPSAVHLKRWRKPKHPPTDHLVVTPKFKTNS